MGVVYFGTSGFSAEEALSELKSENISFDVMQIRSFPFHEDVKKFMLAHEDVFVIEQNRDAQMRTLLINELQVAPAQLHSVLNYDGMPITADTILDQIRKGLNQLKKVSVS